MAAAVESFHLAAEKLLKTPEELPESLVKAIGSMARIAVSKRTPIHLLRHVQKQFLTDAAMGKNGLAEDRYANELRDLRPELQEITRELAIGWLTIVLNNNVMVGFLIRREVEKRRIRNRAEKQTASCSQDETALVDRLLPSMLNWYQFPA